MSDGLIKIVNTLESSVSKVNDTIELELLFEFEENLVDLFVFQKYEDGLDWDGEKNIAMLESFGLYSYLAGELDGKTKKDNKVGASVHCERNGLQAHHGTDRKNSFRIA